MKHDNTKFLEGIIEELESTVFTQANTIEELNKIIEQLRHDKGLWRKAVEDTVTLLLNVELPESYKGIDKEANDNHGN